MAGKDPVLQAKVESACVDLRLWAAFYAPQTAHSLCGSANQESHSSGQWSEFNGCHSRTGGMLYLCATDHRGQWENVVPRVDTTQTDVTPDIRMCGTNSQWHQNILYTFTHSKYTFISLILKTNGCFYVFH